jgi:hypothetical protein
MIEKIDSLFDQMYKAMLEIALVISSYLFMHSALRSEWCILLKMGHEKFKIPCKFLHVCILSVIVIMPGTKEITLQWG